uniref:Uncharacterized protein n=1 Tax=Neobodo designis TaxID=312471 RepID=A0A7S1MJ60_NEODS|mmetsp:Transcript_4154/g.13214  ORF Transcript_4154/g.13214 Transcript_4154/m.13214 type:complete len:384 (+) Transcript_4154:78-1229(+)|eukprot:CAMPEP_0174828596 /NCGR_PEP_ID=MMETSP1114-20130205/1426_1 /TAXON_ID=312471 /ORGANISM="Neobodo designis, Strain CCAP 1951/1" /LENGTH=383 /DNA_ID=CAMNT_0016062317 /DNA_START=78 /DNA_END=1229 /DNA_ORIENTATION=+
MAFRPNACSKHVPRSKSAVPQLPAGPAYIDDPSSIRAAVPDDVRQFPARTAGGSTSVSPVPFNNTGAGSTNARLTGQSPRPSHGGRSHPSFPTSYESRDWQSVTKAEFPARRADVVPPEVQEERKRTQLASSVPVGLCKAAFPTTTHSRDFLPGYRPTDYGEALKVSRRIGGPHDKAHSDVKTAESDRPLPGQYTSMAYRQFQRLPPAGTDTENAKLLKSNANATHWTFGADRTEYTPVSSKPLPSTAPPLKNRPPTPSVPRERNIFVAQSAADARPPRMSATEVAAAKCTSTVPLMGNQVPGSHSSIIPRHLTANAQATPAYVAVRRAAANPTEDTTASGGTSRPGSAARTSGIALGSDKTEYTTMTKGQFRGAFFGRPQQP